jgi:ABC-type amino acid transport substrate-binding protein
LPGTKIPTWDYAAANHLTLATGVGYYYVGTWEDMKINVHTFDSDDACFEDAVKGGAAGCSVGLGSYVLHKLQAPNGPTAKLVSIMVGGPNINGDPNGLAISKDHPALARAVSHAVDELYRNGTVAQTVCEVLQNLPECKLFQLPAQGQGLYLPGPWEVGTLPPASANYPHDVPTVKSGALTLGVTGTSPMLQVSDDGTLKGPEADILNFVAGKLGLTLKGSVVNEVAAALRHGDVDLGAGALAATEEASRKYWQTEAVGFNPDYIYVAPTSSGGLPPYTRWEDVKAAGGKIAVVRGNPRVADLTAAGVDLLLVTDATAGLKALERRPNWVIVKSIGC